MKSNRIFLFLATLSSLMAVGCQSNIQEDAPFQNRLYFVDGASKMEKIPLKVNVTDAVRKLQVAAPKPVAQDVDITIKDDASMVDYYNQGFYDQAIMLPSENYKLEQTSSKMSQGTLLSTPIEVVFKDLDKLSKSQTYVLPVTIANASMPLLKSASTRYYVLKSAPSIELVADMENKNYIKLPTFAEAKPSAEVCNNLSQFTLETLIRVRKFESRIQTIMGTEGYIIIRVSDNGLANNQLQVVTPYGKLTNTNLCMLTTNKWTHIALTFDADAKSVVLYVDGIVAERKDNLISTAPAHFGKPMSTANNNFFIGFSYAQGRELDGEFSECRIWNVARTQEQIASNFYEVDPKAPGLVAYWKLNEGKGRGATDYTGNLNDGVANELIKWSSVWLPAIE